MKNLVEHALVCAKSALLPTRGFGRCRKLSQLSMLLLLGSALLSAATISADSTRGAQVFRTQGCIGCHALKGVGGKIGPDLGKIVDRGFTPAALAATMWNHAPSMWAEMRRRGVTPPAMSEQESADLFAYFYSLRFFEQPGDAGRGKALFTSQKCDACHGLDEPKIKGVNPVAEWTAPASPLELVETMWNHSTAMYALMAQNSVPLPRLTGQNLADLLVYTRSVGARAPREGVFRTTAEDDGQALFKSKGCQTCHAVSTRFLSGGWHPSGTLTDIAADMWNHSVDMSLKNTTFAPGEMRRIVNYIWFSRFIEGGRNTTNGWKAFSAKCAVCHDDPSSGAPSTIGGLTATGKYFTGVTMISALTHHGPAMMEKMQEKHLTWPRFSAEDMSGLMAYLNLRPARGGR
jgi:cytochrome c2